MAASRSDSTYTQYDTALKKWWKYCNNNGLDPFNYDVRNVLKFLSLEYQNGMAGGTLNSFRSAIAAIQGPQLGEDINIRTFFRGIKNLRPSLPKYDVTWDPEIVLKYFKTLPNNEDLNLSELSKKTITLLASTTAHRMQTFSLIKIENIEKSDQEKIIIKIPDRIKTSGKNAIQPSLQLPYYRQDPKICPASTVTAYLEQTKNIRNSSKNLFISCKSPHLPVTSQTLSKWVTKTMTSAGLNTEIFTAHSTRHAATSKAKRCDVSLDTIRKTASWTPTSATFARFYDRPLHEDRNTFATSILENRNQ